MPTYCRLEGDNLFSCVKNIDFFSNNKYTDINEGGTWVTPFEVFPCLAISLKLNVRLRYLEGQPFPCPTINGNLRLIYYIDGIIFWWRGKNV